MGQDHLNPWVILFRSGGFGLVMGAVVGVVVTTYLEIVNSGGFDFGLLLLGGVAGIAFGLTTGLILGLTLVVTKIYTMDSIVPRIIVSLMAIFVVGGLAGLLGTDASEIAWLFGAPAAVAVWVTYPRVVRHPPQPMPQFKEIE